MSYEGRDIQQSNLEPNSAVTGDHRAETSGEVLGPAASADDVIEFTTRLTTDPVTGEKRMLTTAGPATSRKIDGKFSTDGMKIFNTVSGEAIPDDEPLFLLRARDAYAIVAINAYQTATDDVCNELHRAGVQQVREKFCQFAVYHPERMKQPGITKHLKLEGPAASAEPRTQEMSAELRRSAFEISIKQFGHSIERDTSGVYCDDDVDDFWQVWNRACDYAASTEQQDYGRLVKVLEKTEQERDSLRDALRELQACCKKIKWFLSSQSHSWYPKDDAMLEDAIVKAEAELSAAAPIEKTDSPK
jgi:hypothetical protein